MSAKVALLRHGQAASGDSAESRPLTDVGRRQAIAAGLWLEPLGIARAFATATPRARETASLAAPGLTVAPAPGLEGLRIGGDETPLRGVAALGTPFACPAERPPGGESLFDLQERSRAGLARIAAGTGPALVVAHRFVDCVLVAAGLGVALERAEPLLQDPGAVNLWSAEPEPRLLTVNATPGDPLRTFELGHVLPDTTTPIERRRYLLAAGREAPVADAARAAGSGGLATTVEVLAPAEVAAACAEATGLGDGVAARIPSPPGSLAILDEADGRWWVRCLGWTPRPALARAADSVPTLGF
jgi:broad specificity phosphatase PhoE